MADLDLKNTTRKGLYWTAISNIVNKGLLFVFGIILARLLSPQAYGVIGMLSVFICIVSVFIDCGFSQALIIKPNRTQTDFSTEFYFNIGVGIIGYLILFFASPFIATFYQMPILSPILKVIGLGVTINSFCVVQSAQFAIRLDFKTPAKISVITQVLSACIGITLAYLGYEVWALVYQQLSASILNALALWLVVRWRPTLEFSSNSFKYLWGYGSKILGSSLIQQVYDNLYPLVIGKFFSASSLGLFSRANSFASLPSTNFSSIIGNVTFPVLSKLNGDTVRIESVYRRMQKVIAFVVFPMMLVLAAISSPLVQIILNEHWYGCIIMIKLLCFALIWQPISFLQLNVLKAVGRTDIVLKLEIAKRSVGLLSIFGSIPFGIIGMCVGFDFFYLYCFLLNTFYVGKVIGVSLIQQIKDLFPMFINSIIMGTIVWFFTGMDMNIYIVTIVGVLIGILYYGLASKLFMKDTLKEALLMLNFKKL